MMTGIFVARKSLIYALPIGELAIVIYTYSVVVNDSDCQFKF